MARGGVGHGGSATDPHTVWRLELAVEARPCPATRRAQTRVSRASANTVRLAASTPDANPHLAMAPSDATTRLGPKLGCWLLHGAGIAASPRIALHRIVGALCLGQACQTTTTTSPTLTLSCPRAGL